MMELINEASKNDPVFCPNGCGHSYIGSHRKHNLKKHLIYACGKNPQFQCKVCSRKFFYKHALKSHLLTIHNKYLSHYLM